MIVSSEPQNEIVSTNDKNESVSETTEKAVKRRSRQTRQTTPTSTATPPKSSEIIGKSSHDRDEKISANNENVEFFTRNFSVGFTRLGLWKSAAT